MGLREEALQKILSLDSARSAQLSLRLAQEHAHARSGAVVAVVDGRYELFAQEKLDQRGMEQLASAWGSMRPKLLAGHHAMDSDWAVLPIGRPVKGLLFLSGMPIAVAQVHLLREIQRELGQFFELALSLREREPETRLLYETLVEQAPLRELTRLKLLLVLRANDWNKARSARALNVTRATLYNWIRRHGIREDG